MNFMFLLPFRRFRHEKQTQNSLLNKEWSKKKRIQFVFFWFGMMTLVCTFAFARFICSLLLLDHGIILIAFSTSLVSVVPVNWFNRFWYLPTGLLILSFINEIQLTRIISPFKWTNKSRNATKKKEPAKQTKWNDAVLLTGPFFHTIERLAWTFEPDKIHNWIFVFCFVRALLHQPGKQNCTSN